MNTLHTIAFTVYPYVCLAFFLMGSLARFDRDQYTWKSDSSQLLRAGQLRWGSNLFHGGILFLFFGHLFGQLTPHAVYGLVMTSSQKQLLAVIAGGVAGGLCFIGLTMLLHRRLFDPRIRLTSHRTDIAILVILWVQLAIGLSTLPSSLHHVGEPTTMLRLAEYLQGIVLLQPNAALVAGIEWHFQLHMLLGMTIFLLFPFSRLVHVWSGFGTVAYLFRPYQMVRSRRLNVPARQNLPRRAS
ncbi:respiratory nitrate reductase subunit gamma [Roseateles sp. BYS87W]|jgi:nitrate reductase gamma subunit|uniref:Respiratory nitrate reductase subunit gamma n=1 Tax=Pelomonas baiyunensis TaxID=3299026 RepID=A0ABW7GTG2_9BURK